MSPRTCPECGYAPDAGAKFCGACGAALPGDVAPAPPAARGALTPCRDCGQLVSPAAKACPSCGTPHPGSRTAAFLEAVGSTGSAMQGCGCALTLLFTVPFILGLLLLL